MEKTGFMKFMMGWCLMVTLMPATQGQEQNNFVVLAGKGKATSVATPTPSPAPAPAPAYVNLTDLLEVAGPFQTILGMLQSTNTLESVQGQANNSEQGLTLFAPSDPSFAALKKTVLGNLTADQKKALVLAHVLPNFYTLQDFQNFSNPASTMSTGTNGGKYNLNITSKDGAVSVSSGYVTAPITSTVHVTYPVAVYTVPKVLLPEDIFGLPSPSPAPSPAPESTVESPASELSPSGSAKGVSSSPANAPGASSTSAAPALNSIFSPILILLGAAGALML